jgi:hypothetical protein
MSSVIAMSFLFIFINLIIKFYSIYTNEIELLNNNELYLNNFLNVLINIIEIPTEKSLVQWLISVLYLFITWIPAFSIIFLRKNAYFFVFITYIFIKIIETSLMFTQFYIKCYQFVPRCQFLPKYADQLPFGGLTTNIYIVFLFGFISFIWLIITLIYRAVSFKKQPT